MNATQAPRLDWVRINDGMPYNSGRPWVGVGATAGYRIDYGTGWVKLRVFGGVWGYGHGRSMSFASVASAKRGAARIEARRQAEAVA